MSFRARQYHWAGCDWPQRLGINDQLTIWQSGVPLDMPRARLTRCRRLIVRELRYVVRQPGYRTRRVTLVTTLVNAGDYPADAAAECTSGVGSPKSICGT